MLNIRKTTFLPILQKDNYKLIKNIISISLEGDVGLVLHNLKPAIIQSKLVSMYHFDVVWWHFFLPTVFSIWFSFKHHLTQLLIGKTDPLTRMTSVLLYSTHSSLTVSTVFIYTNGFCENARVTLQNLFLDRLSTV